MMDNDKPKGSMNRWNYNEVFKRSTPVPSSNDDTKVWNKVDYAKNRLQSSSSQTSSMPRSWRSLPSTVAPTPGKRVEQEAKYDVDWAYDTQSFYLRVSDSVVLHGRSEFIIMTASDVFCRSFYAGLYMKLYSPKKYW